MKKYAGPLSVKFISETYEIEEICRHPSRNSQYNQFFFYKTTIIDKLKLFHSKIDGGDHFGSNHHMKKNHTYREPVLQLRYTWFLNDIFTNQNNLPTIY